MAKKISAEKRLEKSLEWIDKVFNWAENSKFAVAGKKKAKGVDESSAKQYREDTKAFMKIYAEKHKQSDISKIDPVLGEQLLKEMFPNAYSIKKKLASLDFFQQAALKSGSFKEEVEFANVKSMRTYFKENDIVRRATDSTTMRATHNDIDRVIAEVAKSKSPFKEQTIMALELSRRFGSRISGALEMTGHDLKIEHGELETHHHEKGKKHRWIDFGEDIARIEFAEKIKAGGEHVIETKDGEVKLQFDGLRKKEYSPVHEDWRLIKPMRYRSGDNKGNIMEHEVARKRIAKIIEAAAERAGVSDGKKTFSHHSCRGRFTQDRVDFYATKSMDELHDMVEKRINKNHELQEELKKKGFKTPSVAEKYELMKHRLNWVNEEQRRTKEDREPYHKELCLFLASLDTGHYRNDVIRFYAKYIAPHMEIK